MESNLKAIYIALETAPFAALIIVLPYVVYRYIKTKSVNVWRCTGIYTFTLYCICAYFMTMLPLPEPGSAALSRPWSELIQLIPFKSFYDIRAKTWLRDLAIILFNVVLTMPLGFFLRELFGFDRKKVIIAGFCTAMLFELTQLSGLFFIYPRPYRIADVDDLITNTLGVWLGWLTVPLLSGLLPDLDSSQERLLVQGSEVSFSHRAIAAGIDLCVVVGTVIAVIKGLPGLREMLTGRAGLMRFPVFFLMTVAVSVLYSAAFGGRTPGHRITGLHLVAADSRSAGIRRSVLRTLLLYVGMFSIPFWILFFMSIYTEYSGIKSVVWMLMGAVLMLCAARNMLELMFNAVTHGSSMFYDRIAGTSMAYGGNTKRPRFGIRVIDIRPLRRDTVDCLSGEICDTLHEAGIGREPVTKVRLMAEGVMLDWIESGLEDTRCELRLDKRFNKKALLLSVPGENKTKANPEDTYVTMLGGLQLKLDTYYAAGKNICIIHIP